MKALTIIKISSHTGYLSTGMYCLFSFTIYAPVNNFSVMTGSRCLPGLSKYLAAYKVYCSRTQHGDSASSEAQASNPVIPSPRLYQISHCAPLARVYKGGFYAYATCADLENFVRGFFFS